MSQRICKSYRVLVGMEIHVELCTASKMFSAVPNGATNFGAPPNSLVDEVVLGLPGTLPVMNKRAVEYAIMVGLALNCKIARHTKWDRKSYYYPDLPKNYQISQYDLPLCYQGEFEIVDENGDPKRVRIRRAHLEEDAGKLLHEAPGGFPIDHSIVDLNRAGTPLLEIVTEPDLSSARQVATFAQELQKLVQFLGVSEGQMQLGHMRFEPNINVHITDQDGNVHKTAITEIKNVNSFSVLERATDYEIRRQIQHWEQTGSLGQRSTRGWDESSGTTFLQREKEQAHDYRYFPDPDLMPVEVSEQWLAELRSQVGELPAARRRRYVETLGLSPADAAILAGDRATGDFFEAMIAAGASPRRAGNLVINVLATIANERGVKIPELAVDAARVAKVAAMIDANQIAAASALPLLRELSQTAEDVETAAQRLGLVQSSDTAAIDAAIDAVLAQNPKPVQDYKAGKQAAMGALVGLVMKSTRGLNPKLVQQRLKARLDST
ncbi:Asp-tRNA(Asn)/Glu-tRNA(Gln) amidotransferase subunit GatB [Fontivita pretiosa]|uniref:Asp-tRNA(Asn)/Glu-tRNA(Gln) amidotransferase subunit GatB n=1 Tax=Fontivita pretiosa TaxID=2989684 RepID=UPI003D173913